MRRRLALGALIIAAAALLLLGGAAGLSRLVWGRSLRATIYERMLFKRFASERTAQQEIERLEQKRAKGEARYSIPDSIVLDFPVETRLRGDMQYFALNRREDAPVALIYLHGGAYINGLNAYHWRLMNALAAGTGAEIIAPDYHLAPFGDCRRAYEDLTGLYADYAAAHPDRPLILIGDSAGGGLALGLAEHLIREGLPLPRQLILISPWVDVTMENPDIEPLLPVEPVLHLELVKVHGRYWANDLDPHDWRVSPLFGEMAGLPPVTLYTGTRELLYPDALRLNQALTDAGVQVELRVGRGLNHEYPLMPIPEAKAAIREMVAAING